MSRKTLRVNRTKGNLKLVYNQLDEASGNLYNALDNIQRFVDISPRAEGIIKQIDAGLIDSLRDEIEKMIIEKEGSEHGK